MIRASVGGNREAFHNVKQMDENVLQTKKSADSIRTVTVMWRCCLVLSGAPGGGGSVRWYSCTPMHTTTVMEGMTNGTTRRKDNKKSPALGNTQYIKNPVTATQLYIAPNSTILDVFLDKTIVSTQTNASKYTKYITKEK